LSEERHGSLFFDCNRRLWRFSDCYTPKLMLPSGFFFKKKLPGTIPEGGRLLWNRYNSDYA
jgi:hypothetical protein